MCVFGTRPEAIKMAPVVKALEQTDSVNSFVCVTAQHRKMLDQVLDLFDITPDYDLDIMSPGQDLYSLTANILIQLRDVYKEVKPDIVLVHGDTTTCFVASLTAFYEQIPVAHVEAGLRTGNILAPFPEEANRSLVGRIAQYHFAPTVKAMTHLLAENVPKDSIYITGNTVIDALLMVSNKVSSMPDSDWKSHFGEELFERIIDNNRRLILITGHRRENFGQGMLNLCSAIKILADRFPDCDFIYPVHLNPNVKEPVYEVLSGYENIILIPPEDYAPFVWLMGKSYLVITDSGGIQEEAPSLGKPVLVTRDVTERREALEAGTIKLVGTNTTKIVHETSLLLLNQVKYSTMSTAVNPFGNGDSARQIVSLLLEKFCM